MEELTQEGGLAAGTAFGDYEVVEILGSGGMGQVWKARHRTLERDVALKILFPRLAADEFFVSRFLKEARSAARLNHPNIVQIYDFGKVGSQYYLAMEYVDGRSLGRLLKNWGPFAEAQAVALMRQACVALSVAHGAGIIHRDVKPENFMLTRKGQLKLVDLGLAKRTDDEAGHSLTGLSAGTPHYISPEQIEGRRDVDGRSDIYSLGGTLFHLVTGQPPFPGPSSPVIMSRHLNDRRPDPRGIVPGLSAGLAAVIMKMMAKSRDDRYADVFALDADLYRLQTGEFVDAEGETMIGQSKPEPPTRTEEIPDLRAALSSPRFTRPMPALSRDDVYAAPAPIQPGPPPGSAPPPPPPPGSGPSASRPESDADPAPSVPSGWDPWLLTRLEERLAPLVGPLARVLVRRTAKTSNDLRQLVDRLAAQVPDEVARKRFAAAALSEVGVTPPSRPGSTTRLPSPEVTAPTRLSGGVTPAGSPTSYGGGLSDADLARATEALAPIVGPLAKVLVRKAAKEATGWTDLVELLCGALDSDPDRRRLRQALKP